MPTAFIKNIPPASTKINSAYKAMLPSQKRALGEIIFNNGRCQILTQSVSRFELIVADEEKNEIAEYTLDIELPDEDEEGNESGGTIFRALTKDVLSGTNTHMPACGR